MLKNLHNISLLSLAIMGMGMQAASADEILIGVESPITGVLAREGSGMVEGIEIAAKIFNETNGKHTIKIIKIDDESQPDKAVSAVEKLAADGVLAITGGYGSNNVGPASDTADKLGLSYLTSGAVADSLTQHGNKHFFRINNSAGYQKALVGVVKDLDIKSISILSSTREANAYLARDAAKELEEMGIKVVAHSFDPATTDFKPLLNKVRLRDKTEAVMMVGYENDYVGILRAARVLKIKTNAFIGAWGLVTPKMVQEFPDIMQNVFATALLPNPVEFTSEEGTLFANAYKEQFKDDVGYIQQFGYVQGKILFEAAARAADNGNLTREGVTQELRATDAETLIGRVQFNEQGDNDNFTHKIGQVQGDKIYLVWPQDSANGEMVYPGLPW